MSSVQDVEKCPHCGGLYIVDFDCNTLESYYYCNRCGKYENYEFERDENGKAILDENGHPKRTQSNGGGYGCVAIAIKDGFREVYHLQKAVDVEIKNDYLETMKDPNVDKEKSYLTAWNEERSEIIAVFGKLPQLYDEYMNEAEGDEAESA